MVFGILYLISILKKVGKNKESQAVKNYFDLLFNKR